MQVADPLGADPSLVPTVGSKELVALLPTLLGLRGAGTVVIPEVAYPTYEVGAVLAGLAVRRTDTPPRRRRRHRPGLAELARATRTAGC